MYHPGSPWAAHEDPYSGLICATALVSGGVCHQSNKIHTHVCVMIGVGVHVIL